MSLTDLETREARVLRERLTYGFGGLDAVESWAGPILARLERPPYPLIQLGLARANGARVCCEAFDAMGIGDISPTDIASVLASADFSVLSLDDLEFYFVNLWQRMVPLLVDGSPGEEGVVSFLFDSSQIELAIKSMRSGELDAVHVRRMIANYALEAREVVARSGAARD
jgi:hypothetical protein